MNRKRKKINFKKLGERSLSLLLAVLICMQIVDLSVIRSIAAEISESESSSITDTDTAEDVGSDSDLETDSQLDDGSEETDSQEVSNAPEEASGVVNDEPVYEDLTVSNSYTMTSDMDVKDLNVTNGTFDVNGYQLTIHGNMNVKGSFRINRGCVNCFGDVTFNGSNKLIMDNINDYFLINGSLIWKSGSSSKIKSGTIEIKGDFKDENKDRGYWFKASGENKVILSGTERQNIVQSSPNSFFNILELQNTSSDGVYADAPINAGEIRRNGLNLTYSVPGTFGWTLQHDDVVNGDLYLTGDVLDLNGHTLTIHGSLIHAAGKVAVNGGTLKIDQDYRLQSYIYDKAGNLVDSYSTGCLEMTNENDTVKVNGDFYTKSIYDHRGKLTNGKLYVRGDFEQAQKINGTDYTLYNFAASDDHTVIFNGSLPQSIKFHDGPYLYSQFAVLELANTSTEGVTVNDYVSIAALLKNTSCRVNGAIRLKKDAELFENKCKNDISVVESKSLTCDITIDGDLYLKSQLDLKGHKLTVTGNTYIKSGTLKLSNGEFICNGNVRCESSTSRAVILMEKENDHAVINGDFYCKSYSSTDYSDGILEVSGNIIIEKNFMAKKNHRVVLSGTKKQTITCTDSNSYFNIVEVKNEDGIVEIGENFKCSELIRNDCRVVMTNGDSFGWTLTKDETIDTDLILGADELNLNGHTLTINGDLVQSGGTVNVNGGTLNIRKDYRIQKKVTSDGDKVSYLQSTGCLVMTNAEDTVNVDGSFYTSSVSNHSGKLTNGKLSIKGNFVQNIINNVDNSKYNFKATDDHTVVFNGTKAQSITLAQTNKNSYFSKLEFANTSTDGISLNEYVFVNKEFKNPSTKVNGDIKLRSSAAISGKVCNNDVTIAGCVELSDDITINGNLTIYDELYLKGHDLTVKGKLEIVYGYNTHTCIRMLDDSEKVVVYGDFIADSHYTIEYKAGTLEVKGDVEIKSGFSSIGTHRLLLSGTGEQKITAASPSIRFNIVEINARENEEDEVELGDNFNCEEFINHGCRVVMSNGTFVGWKLTKNETIDTDLYLGGGDLDLNGHILIVKGDLIQSGGNVKINGGTLDVIGDYRLQTEKRDSYNNKYYQESAGSLIMTNASDTVYIDGSFYAASVNDHKNKLTNGSLHVKGGLIQETNKFETSDDHKVILNGTKAQTITNKDWFFANLELANTSKEGVVIDNASVYVVKELKNPSSNVNGIIGLGSNAELNGNYCKNDIVIDKEKKLSSDITIDGDLYVKNKLSLDGHTLTVNGDTNVTNGLVNVSKGELKCKGNLQCESSSSAMTCISMTDKADKVIVDGDFTFSNYNYVNNKMNAGEMEFKGDVKIIANFTASGTHKVILGGSKKQTVSFEKVTYTFNIVELKNYSEDGVFCTSVLNAAEIITNDCNLTYSGNDRVGWTLTDDITIDGDLSLAGGTLDLAGHKLTVNGNLIQKSGTVLIDHGTLTVNNDYRIQIPTDDADVYDASNGILKMTNSDDHVIVKGTFATSSSKSHEDLLTAGTMEVGGDFYRISTVSANFRSSKTFTIKFNGSKKQIISYKDNLTPGIANIVFENSSSQGIEIDGTLYISGSVKDLSKNVKGFVRVKSLSAFDSNSFSGSVELYDNSKAKLEDSFTVGETFKTPYSLDLNGKVLNAGSIQISNYFKLNGASVNCINDFTVYSGGQLMMTNEHDRIIVGGNFTTNSGCSHSGKLTNGILEVKGDFTQNGTKDSFLCSENHQTKLTGKSGTYGRTYKQTIKFTNPDNSRFNNLILTRSIDHYSFTPSVDKISQNYSVLIQDTEAPEKVLGLTADSVGVSKVSLSWLPTEDNDKVFGYEIYRNNERVATVTGTSFNDVKLLPETQYIYKVRAFDMARNVSEYSNAVSVTTGADTEAPEVPVGLRVKYSTGRSIRLAWMPSSDNVGVKKYKIYRDDHEIAEVSGTEYKDTSVNPGPLYTYKIRAVDASGNISGFSDPEEAHMVQPIITSFYPKDNTEICEGRQFLSVYYPGLYNVVGNKVKFEYSLKNKDDWKPISKELIGQKRQSDDTLYSSCTWDTSKLESGWYEVRFTLYDDDNCAVYKKAAYYINNEPPAPVKSVNATTENGEITILWDSSSSVSCTYYKLYKAKGTDDFEFVDSISGHDTIVYLDKDVSPDILYSYYVTAVDKYGHESEKSKSCSVTASVDKEKPHITSILSSKRISGSSTVQVAAYDNISVARIQLQYLDSKDAKWKDIGTTDCKNNKANISWNTSSLKDGEYEVRAFAWDKSGNKSEEDYSDTFTIDNTGPSKIELSESTASSSIVSIRWKDVAEPDFSYFCVEQKKGGQFVRIGTESNTLGMHVKDLKPLTKYEFRVVGYDDLGNRGVQSDVLEISTLADDVKPYIESFGPAQSYFKKNISLTVRAKDNCEVSALKLYYSDDNKETWKSIASLTPEEKNTSCDFTYDFNGENAAEGEVYFKAIAVDGSGNESSPVIAVHRLDRTDPQKIADLVASDEKGYVSLNWTTLDEDVEHFVLSRADEENGVYFDIETKLTTKNYYDTNVEYNKVYSYRVRAVDAAGNESELSNETIVQISKDTEPPKIYGVSPSSGSVLPKTPTISVVAHDAKLDTICVEYRKHGEEVWSDFGIKRSINGSFEKVDFEWDEADCSDGLYEFRAYALDAEGNISDIYTFKYTLDTKAPEKPELNVTYGDYQIELRWQKSSAPDFDCFLLYRKADFENEYTMIASPEDGVYIDKDVIPGYFYTYKIEAYDHVGNMSVSTPVFGMAYDNDIVPPTASVPDDITAIAGHEIVLDGTQSYDNIRIENYSWELGNGDIVEGARARYVYDSPGTYKAKLTVADGVGNTDEAEFSITVLDQRTAGSKTFRVFGSNYEPLAGAYVYLYDAGGDNKCLCTDSQGFVTVAGMFGQQTIAVFSDGYIPKEHSFIINSVYDDTPENVNLDRGDVVIGDFSAHRMTLEEMVEAGIDFSNPDNIDTFEFEVVLKFMECPIPENVYFVINSVGGGSHRKTPSGGGPMKIGNGGGSIGSSSINIVPVKVNDKTDDMVFYYTKTKPERISWLKEMYDVELGIVNAADPQFSLENCRASLTVPDGLSLAVTSSGQSLTQYLGTINGRKSKSAHWYIKGDKRGDYDLTAAFHGTLMPFNAPINVSFKTEKPIVVERGEGLVLYVYPEDAAYKCENYYVQYVLKNESGREFYNVEVTFDEYTVPEAVHTMKIRQPNGKTELKTYRQAGYTIEGANKCRILPIMRGGETLKIGILSPGESLRGTFTKNVSEFDFGEEYEESYYKLVDTFVKTLGDKNTGIEIKVAPIPAHISKSNVRVVNVPNLWADPVDMSTGAFTDSINALTINGNPSLSFDLKYNSLNSKQGECGYGWTHGYESKVVNESGSPIVYLDSENYITFVSNEAIKGEVYGTIDSDETASSDNNSSDEPFDKVYVKLDSTEYNGVMDYTCTSNGMQDYKLHRDDNGCYALTFPDGTVWNYDSDGRITKMLQPSGRSADISYGDKSMTITDPISGRYLAADYNDDGLLTSVYDSAGRKTFFAYEDGCLVSYTNAVGETVRYVYNDDHRIVSEVNASGVTFVENEYDDEGRVISQDDALSDTPLTTFEYDVALNKSTLTTGTDRNGNTVKFLSDQFGHITQKIDRNGNTTYYNYDNRGNLISETNPIGGKTTYTYDDKNNILSITDCAGHKTLMSYDEAGDLVKLSGPLNTVNSYTYSNKNMMTSEEYQKPKKTYSYDENGMLTEQNTEGLGSITYSYTNGLMTSVSDYKGQKTYKEYDACGNLIKDTYPDGTFTLYDYDELNRQTRITDSTGGTTCYTYDIYGNIASVTDANGGVTVNEYNDNNWLISSTDARGKVTTYEYDNEGNNTKVNHPDGTSSSSEFDAEGNVTKKIDENGGEYLFKYDAAGNVISETLPNGSETKYNYYPDGHKKRAYYADKTYVDYFYDDLWKVSQTIDRFGNVYSYEYDEYNNVTKIVDPLDNVVTNKYDYYGRLVSTTDANGNKSTFKYDANGNCIQKTNPNGVVSLLDYDCRNRLTQITIKTDEKDYSVKYEYDALGRVTKYTDEEGNEFRTEYDRLGNVTAVIDAKGNVTSRTEYDAAGNVTKTTDALGVSSMFEYDETGNLEKTTNYAGQPTQSVTSFSYDALDRLISSVDAEEGTSSYTYDSVGNITSVTDPNGGTSTYAYDSMSRMTESVNAIGRKNSYTYNAQGLLAEAKDAKNQSTTYVYDALGRITSYTDNLGTVSYTYDGNGNVLTVTDSSGTITRKYDCMNRVTEYTDARGNTVKYGYDTLGNLVTLTYPGGEIVRYSYYPTGRLKTVTDWNNNVTKYEYDGNGRLTKTTRPDGSVETREYDAAGKLTKQNDIKGDKVINSFTYEYDTTGNIVNMASQTAAEDTVKLQSATMEYDKANRLMKYNGEEVSYDANGNMILGPLNGVMTVFKYDCRNRLIFAGNTQYTYDAENNRTSVTVDGVKTEYVVENNSGELSRILTSKTNGKTTKYIYGSGLIAQTDDENGYLYYHFNNIGSTTAITDGEGKLKYAFSYSTYGELTSGDTHGIMFLYNGEYGVATDANGLYYMRARYYNTDIKRFINQDVVEGNITNSPSLNKYAYCQGNPVSLLDPFGLFPMTAKDWGHLALDVLGFVPGLGIVADIANGLWYLHDGDYLNAAACFIAAIPLIGDAIGGSAKLGLKGTCLGSKIIFAGKALGAAGEFGLALGQIYNASKALADKHIMNHQAWDDESSQILAGGLFALGGALLAGVELGTNLDGFASSQCFIAGTMVLTIAGKKAIEEVKAGDLVYSTDVSTGESDYKEVVQTFENETDELVHITVDGEEITTTPKHPFYVPCKGWTSAIDLRAGDILVLSNGEYVTVEKVQHEILESPVKVYNFEVRDYHTYYVGENSVLVHNDCTPLTWNEYQHENQGKTSEENSKGWADYKKQNYPNEGEHYLHRPYLREDTMREINNNKITNPQGQIYDSISDKWVDPDKVELGHVADHEFWFERNKAEQNGWTQAQFNDYMNNPDFYAWQGIHDNRSHKFESKH